METAKRMAYVAKECGADIVKYQTAVPELVVSRFAEKAEYQKQTTDAAESQLEMIRKLHFSFEGHRELKEYCDSIGIQYLSAPFDIPSVRFLGTLGMPLIKIPSGEITNLPYLEEIGKLHTPALKLQQTVVGRQSETTVAVLYVDGIADPARVQRILDRLDTIDEQALLGRGDLEPYLTHRPRALLPQLGQTERPDKFAGALLDGCVGLLVDGLPMGYLLPTTFHLLMHAPEDESHNYLLASALIVLRYFALAISLMFPALYVAVAMYHQEMIPAKLLLSVIQAKQQVPFSVPAIILFMLIAFELLQEAGLRLPNSIGQTVSIIGALLVGQSAVDAKVVSPVAIIVVALAGIAGYTLPNQELSNAVRLLRLGLVLAAFLYLLLRRRDFAILRAMGVPNGPAARGLLGPVALLGLLGIAAGSIPAWGYAMRKTAETLATISGPEGAEVSVELSRLYLVGICACVWALLVAFVAIGAGRLSRRPALELLQGAAGGRKKRKKDIAKATATGGEARKSVSAGEGAPGGKRANLAGADRCPQGAAPGTGGPAWEYPAGMCCGRSAAPL